MRRNNRENLRIVLLGPSAPYRGGIVHFNSKLGAELLETSGVETKLFFWKRLYPTIILPKSEKEFQDHESKTNFLNKGESLLDYMNPFTWLRLVFYIRQLDADIFLTHWTQPVHFPVFLIAFLLIRLFTNTKIYLIAHNVTQHEDSFLNKILTKKIFRLADKVIVHAKIEADEAEKITKKQKVITAFHPLYNIFPIDKGFDVREFKKELGLKKRVILFFGFIRPYKGLEYLIEAFKDVSGKLDDVSLLIVGELFWKVDEKKNLSFFNKLKRMPFQLLKKFALKGDVEKYNPIELIKEYKLEDKCVVIDHYVPNEEVFKYYKSADVFVAPYTSASQSGPVQIAYAFDLPVIVSNVGGLKDVVKEGVSGYLAKSKDPQDLSEKIVKMLKSDQFKSEEISKFKKRFYWSEYIKLILK